MNVDRHRQAILDLPGASESCIRSFLQRPRKTLRAILSRSRLEVQGPDSFSYSSRPIGLAQWQITPRLQLWGRWEAGVLDIRSRECSLDGLGDWQKAISFSFAAQLLPSDQACHASVSASLLIDQQGALSLIPQALLNTLADQALDQALIRMERRCQGGLRQHILQACCAQAFT